tara:strand:- start:126 stop:608 length:483 start_codon:yes stop_codon:yes gene_type:complete
MTGIHKFSGSFSHSGSAPATFQAGISSSGVITGTFIGNGKLLTNLNLETTTTRLFFGSESIGTPNTYGNWNKGGGGNQTILLSTSASNGNFNHFTFLKLETDGWEEVSDYDGTLNGLRSVRSLSQTLGTGIYEYLLLAMSTASKETVTAGATVVINPEEF